MSRCTSRGANPRPHLRPSCARSSHSRPKHWVRGVSREADRPHDDHPPFSARKRFPRPSRHLRARRFAVAGRRSSCGARSAWRCPSVIPPCWRVLCFPAADRAPPSASANGSGRLVAAESLDQGCDLRRARRAKPRPRRRARTGFTLDELTASGRAAACADHQSALRGVLPLWCSSS